MKITFKLIMANIFCLSLLCFGKTIINAQEKSKNLCGLENNAEEVIFKPENYKHWKKYTLGKFSVYLPEDYDLQKKTGTDLGFRGYKTDDIDLQIYMGSRLPEQSPIEKKFPTYKEKSFCVNNFFADISSYEYEVKFYPYRYIQIAQYYLNKSTRQDGMVIYIGSKEEIAKLAEKIFLSVQLINKDEDKTDHTNTKLRKTVKKKSS